MIQGHGNSKADILFLADGGYNDCATTNYSLAGYNTRQLEMLSGGNFHVDECYLTSLIKEKINYQPLDAKTPYYRRPEVPQLIEQYQEVLLDEIKNINPNLIIPLGEIGFKFLTNFDGIRKFRGSVLLCNPIFQFAKQIKVLPTFGPHVWNSEFKQRWITKIDFCKVPANRGTELPDEQRHNLWIARSASALRAFLARHVDANHLVFDIETFSGIPTCISFCFDGIESVCIPFLDKEVDFDNRVLMFQLVAKTLASGIPKINQNIKYDWRCLETFNVKVNNVVGDTMLASSCLLPELPKNLGFLTSVYTDLPYFKDEGREFNPSIHSRDRFYLYNAKDSLSVHQIHTKQLAEIHEVGSSYVYESLVSLIPIYKKMEDNGLLYDDQARQMLLAKYTTLYEIEKIKLAKLANVGLVNPQSPKQIANLVYEELGYERSKEASATGEEELEWLAAFGKAKRSPIFGAQVLQSVINSRKLHKVIEYLETIPYPDGRWRCEYNLSGTETGRSSAGVTTDALFISETTKKGIKTVLERLGRSFQTLAKHGFRINGELFGRDLRTIFVPTRGYSYVEVDLSQAEARVDTVLAGNFGLLKEFDGPVGIHRLTGSWVYNCDPLDIKKDTIEYLMSKTVRHAAERNMKYNRLVMMTQCQPEEAQRVLAAIHSKQPELKEVYHREVRTAIDSTRTLESPNGRRRQFLDRINEHLYNEAISQLPQAIVSDQTKFSLIPTMAKCDEFVNLINEAHDGTLAEVIIGREEEYVREYKCNVEKGIDFRRGSLKRDFELIIPSEASISTTNWMEMRKYDV